MSVYYNFSYFIYLGDEHLNGSFDEQRLPSEPIDEEISHQGGEHVDGARHHGGQKRGLVAEPDGLEEHWHVEKDDVDARELLEHLEQHRHHELRPVGAPQHGLVGALALLGVLGGAHDGLELPVHVVDAPDLLEGAEGLVLVAPLDEAGGGFDDEEGAEEEDEGGDGGPGEGEPPAEGVEAGCGVVDQVGAENAYRDEELEADVEASSVS